ncbi:AraC family ligand binding domain-containing protein [Ruthenibacterium lactatiformans]|uniref:AraC family ligand binding domain-containing protein n=1 Tax=Ruthenibacterium lactatiformans TaxID=1550024 RepID=UPI001967EF27|nr:AraC family ligand binding domain-containing protein [Ruthenibacterium lactatiformans]MBN3009695.1 AraC family ligand binding domain-containing protein [Ruthenibacterium lactatiformans]
MIAKLEKRYYAGNERVWVGEYKNLHNISHWHMEHELILCKTGTAHITLNEHEYSLTPGKGLLCYSGNIHSINAGQDCVLFVSLLDSMVYYLISGVFWRILPVAPENLIAKCFLQ